MINKHGRRFSLQKCMERVKMYEFTWASPVIAKPYLGLIEAIHMQLPIYHVIGFQQ
jgi:hypothetical protein